MRKKVTLVTGAAGEIGQALIHQLIEQGERNILTYDLHPVPLGLNGLVTHIQGDILNKVLLDRLVSEYEFEAIYHLAALLSTRSEFSPDMAHRVNVEGTLKLIQLAAEQSERQGKGVRFIFPSSIAAYGMPDLETKAKIGKVKEWEWNYPTTMYGCNKLYCELLGVYFARHFHQLAAKRPELIDFRSLRFPGLISAYTVPSGGTSDYAPEMLHAAAQGKPYECFVREDTRIPFMAMPDAVKALLALEDTPEENLNHRVYNINSFSLAAAEVQELVLDAFPDAEITFKPDLKRQGIVDSWPADLDDNAARKDWGWAPEYDVDRAFTDYLIPNIRKRYQG